MKLTFAALIFFFVLSLPLVPFFGVVYASILFISLVISYFLFIKYKKDSTGDAFAFSSVILTLYGILLVDIIRNIVSKSNDYSSVFGFLPFPVFLTILFVFLLRSEGKANRQEEPQLAVPLTPPSRLEENALSNLRKLNAINLTLHIILLGLSGVSFFLIPHAIAVDNALVYILYSSLLFLFVFLTLYRGALMRNPFKNGQNRQAVRYALSSALTGKIPSSTVYQMLETGESSIYKRVWSPFGYYIMMLFLLPASLFVFAFPLDPNSNGENIGQNMLYAIKNIPYIQIVLSIIILIYLVCLVPLILYNFLFQKTANPSPAKQRLSLKGYVTYNVVFLGVVVLLSSSMVAGAVFGDFTSTQGMAVRKFKQQQEKIAQMQLSISEEDTSLQFEESDFALMEEKIHDLAGDNSTITFLSIGNAEQDANTEKYITATYISQVKGDEEVTVYIFRKYLTGSNYHPLGEVELYLSYVSDALKK